MAKASVVAAKQANAVASMDERLASLEQKLDQVLAERATVTLDAMEGEGVWALTDEEMVRLFGSVEQVCQKAGVSWEAPLLTDEAFDPIAHLTAHLNKVADRVGMPTPAAQEKRK